MFHTVQRKKLKNSWIDNSRLIVEVTSRPLCFEVQAIWSFNCVILQKEVKALIFMMAWVENLFCKSYTSTYSGNPSKGGVNQHLYNAILQKEVNVNWWQGRDLNVLNLFYIQCLRMWNTLISINDLI